MGLESADVSFDLVPLLQDHIRIATILNFDGNEKCHLAQKLQFQANFGPLGIKD